MSAKTGQRRLGHIRKLESGRFQASFIGPDLRRYNGPRPFDSKMLAEGWLAREREMIMLSDSGGAGWISPVERRTRAAVRGETVESYAKRWIAGRNLAPRTRKLYTESLAHHIAPSLGEIGIGSLSADHGESLAREDAHRQTHGARSRLRPTSCPLRFRRRRRTTDQEPLSDQAGDEHESQTGTGSAFGKRIGEGCRRDPTRTIQGDGVAFGLGRTAIRGSHRVTAKGYRGGLRGHHRFTGRHTSRRVRCQNAEIRKDPHNRSAFAYPSRSQTPLGHLCWYATGFASVCFGSQRVSCVAERIS